MFLNTRMKKPIIADRDIDCYIYIRKYDHIKEEKKHGLNWLMHRIIHKCDPTGIIFTKYYEPFRNVEIKPGTTVTGKTNRVYSGKYNGRNHYRVDDGFVNAMLRSDYYGIAVPYKATVPAGTEFYINNGFFRIAARKIKVSKEKVSSIPSWREVISPISPILAEELFGDDNTLRPGFYYLCDGTYANPNTMPSDKRSLVSGIVSNVDGDKITIISLDEKEMLWCEDEHPKRVCQDSDIHLSGNDLTLAIMRNENYSDKFTATRWCSKYEVPGGLRGNWHIGSVDEVIGAVRDNMLEINVAISLLDESFSMLDCLSSYWTGYDTEDNYARAIDATDGTIISSHKSTAHLKLRAFMTKIKPNQLFI